MELETRNINKPIYVKNITYTFITLPLTIVSKQSVKINDEIIFTSFYNPSIKVRFRFTLKVISTQGYTQKNSLF